MIGSCMGVYLVTGGCGFTGEKIVELLSQQDYIKEVRVFDSVARGEAEKFTIGKKSSNSKGNKKIMFLNRSNQLPILRKITPNP
uniref:3-beta hydroxysteroid dehydrogenase/isomerase domain-containing protein n=1 Tax=Falco tinnunculus TaxID=100819 RepID=A0A8C4UIS0_FALTI